MSNRSSQDQASENREHVCWPADRFYWVLIPAAASVDRAPLTGARLDPSNVADAISEAVPIDGSLIHWSVITLPDGAALACVALCTDLDALDPEVRTLRPVGVPPHLANRVDADTISDLNLLHGVYESPVIRRARSALVAAWVWTAAATIALTGGGLSVRAWTDARSAAQINEARERLAARTLETTSVASSPPESSPSPMSGKTSSLSASQRLESAKARLERERGDRVRVLASHDAGDAIQDVLTAWPRDLQTRIDSLSIGESSLRLSGSLASLDDVATLTEHLRSVRGWTLEQPQVSMLGERATIRTTMLRETRPKRTNPPMGLRSSTPQQTASRSERSAHSQSSLGTISSAMDPMESRR